MLIAVISDTHKNERSINVANKHIKQANADIIIHLGDCVGDVEFLKEEFNGKVYAVEGNCDNLNKYAKEGILEINEKKIYPTHEPFKEDKNGMILMNPGSISKPILRDRCIGFIEINDDGNIARSELMAVKLFE